MQMRILSQHFLTPRYSAALCSLTLVVQTSPHHPISKGAFRNLAEQIPGAVQLRGPYCKSVKENFVQIGREMPVRRNADLGRGPKRRTKELAVLYIQWSSRVENRVVLS